MGKPSDQGASPDGDRATRPADQAPACLGDTASVPSAWPEVEWDDEGYPTAEDDDFLAWAGLPLDFKEAAKFVLRELPKAAEHCVAFCATSEVEEYGELITRIDFSTGGWSGAESLIAFIGSRFDTRHFMESWRRGGHYVFEVPHYHLASAIEARRAADSEAGAVADESAAAKPDAQPQGNHSSARKD